MLGKPLPTACVLFCVVLFGVIAQVSVPLPNCDVALRLSAVDSAGNLVCERRTLGCCFVQWGEVWDSRALGGGGLSLLLENHNLLPTGVHTHVRDQGTSDMLLYWVRDNQAPDTSVSFSAGTTLVSVCLWVPSSLQATLVGPELGQRA